jgi:hypothetical protein
VRCERIRHLHAIVPLTCRSINPKTASINAALNLDTSPRVPLRLALVVVGEIERVTHKRSS